MGLDLEGEAEVLPPSRKSQGARVEVASPEVVERYKEWEKNRNLVLRRIIDMTAFPAEMEKGFEFSEYDESRMDPAVARMLADKIIKIGDKSFITEEARRFNARPA